MPRPVNFSSALAAFSALGQANARRANLVLNQRELERQERASTGALAGSIIGGVVGGPAGAAAGGFIGTKLAGGRTTPGQARAAGSAFTQALQPSQEEQNQQAQRELIQARQQRELPDGSLVSPSFEQSFQPAQPEVTPEQVAQREAPQFQPLPPDTRAGFEQAFQPVQPGPLRPPDSLGVSASAFDREGVQRRPTLEQQLQAERETKLVRREEARQAPTPQPLGENLLPTERVSPLTRLRNKQSNNLEKARAVSRDPSLSPKAFGIQKKRITNLEKKLEKTEFSLAKSGEKRVGDTFLKVQESRANAKGLNNIRKFRENPLQNKDALIESLDDPFISKSTQNSINNEIIRSINNKEDKKTVAKATDIFSDKTKTRNEKVKELSKLLAETNTQQGKEAINTLLKPIERKGSAANRINELKLRFLKKAEAGTLTRKDKLIFSFFAKSPEAIILSEALFGEDNFNEQSTNIDKASIITSARAKVTPKNRNVIIKRMVENGFTKKEAEEALK